MRTYILPFVCLMILASCQEDEPVIHYADPFAGSWTMSNPELNLNISFDITQSGGELSFKNITVDYPEITEDLNYNVELFDRYPVNPGFGGIKIYGTGDQQWIVFIMSHNRIHLDQDDELLVYNIQIEMVNRLPIELENQVFIREIK